MVVGCWLLVVGCWLWLWLWLWLLLLMMFVLVLFGLETVCAPAAISA